MKTTILNYIKQESKFWWTSLLVGILAVILGIWCFFTPGDALIALTYVFITAIFVSGIFDIVFALSNRKIYSGWGWTFAGGILDIVFGILLLILPPPVITMIFIYFIGFWLMFRSIWTIGAAFELNRFISAGWLLIIGFLSLIFSFLFLLSPVFGSISIVILAGSAFIFYGIFRIYYAFELKALNKDINKYLSE